MKVPGRSDRGIQRLRIESRGSYIREEAMSEQGRLRRDAITRAWFFLGQARSCPYSDEPTARESFEAFLEATIVFSSVAVHRLHREALRRAKIDPSLKAAVDAWWASLLNDPASQFFRVERDFIAKVGPPKVGQIVRMGGPAPRMMEELYFYETSDIPATETIERHLSSVERIVTDAEKRFGTATLLGLWEE
jgi:hypothetical protein